MVQKGEQGVLYLRLEYECNDISKENFPWSVMLELRNEYFSDDAAVFTKEIDDWLIGNGYAPTLTNSVNTMSHLHGAKLNGWVAEYEPDCNS